MNHDNKGIYLKYSISQSAGLHISKGSNLEKYLTIYLSKFMSAVYT